MFCHASPAWPGPCPCPGLWQRWDPAAAPCQPCGVGTPTCHPQVHTEGVPACGAGEGKPILPHPPAAQGSPGAQGIWEPEPSLCSLLPVCAELRPPALTTLSSNVAPVCSLDKAPCPTRGRHAASPEPTGIPLCQGWASSFSCACDELWQVSAAGPCCHHAGDPLPLPRQQGQE